MRRPRVQLILPLACIVGAFVLVARSAAPADAIPGPPQPNTTASDSGAILVKYRPSTTAAQATFVQVARGDQTAGGIPELSVTRLKVPRGQAKQSAASYQQSGLVDFAEEDSTVSTQLTPNDPYFASAYPTTTFGKTSQWAPQFVSAPAAWDTTQGDAAITIAIVDTGIDAGYPDLQGKIVGGTSFIGKLADENGHGTHVAGIAAADTNNGAGVAGICPRCTLMPVRVLDANGSGLLSDVAAGIIYAADHGARVINLSLGGTSASQTMHAAIDYAFAHNALPVAAMGNSSTTTPLEPARWYNALSVAAVDRNGARATFSSYGPQTDVAAPGVGILSTLPTYAVTLTQKYKQGYDALSGTSMATPVVSGLAGLVLSRNPTLTAAQVKGIIEATAGDGSSFNADTGFGVVNAAKAVALAAHTDGTPPNVGAIAPSSATSASKTVLLAATPTDAGGVHHVDFVIDGQRAGSPGTAGSTGGGKKGATTTAAAWSTSWDSRTVWNGPRPMTVVAFDDAGNPTSADSPISVNNAYATAAWTMHLCNPATSSCPYYALESLPLTHAAVAHLQVNWTYTAVSGYTNATMWASIFDGFTQQLLFTQGTSLDFLPDVRLCGCTANSIGTGMAGTLRKGGGAATDVTLTVTYPD